MKKADILYSVFFGLMILTSLAFSYFNFVIKENYSTYYSEDTVPTDMEVIKNFFNLK